ncbi:MAG TPA: PKD domain-containing protein, partial [Thermoplasmata archaeon]|nr:PKD domain-containing protein [Thermoplasmata archaeon]
GWPITVGGVHPVYLRNTTSTNASFSATNGIPLYALVVAWNSWGAGSAPSGGPSIATPAPFVLESFRPAPSTPPGGPVPFTANFAAVTSSGTNDPVVQTVLSVDSFNPRLTLTATPTIAVSGNVSFLNASLTFPIQGTFTVVLHAEDRTFDTALVDLLTIYVGPGAAPTPSLVVSTPAPFVGRPVAFVGLASGSPGPYNYSWAFGDGQALFDGGPTPKHTYDTAGLFTIVLTVRDNTTGGVATSTLPVEISGAPVVRIAASVGTHGPLSYIFQAIELGGSGPPTLSWSFGDGTTSTGQNATHTYADPGLFTVRVIATDPAGLTASANLSISPGVARAATPFLASSSGIAIILLLLVGLIALGAISAFLFLRLRQQKVRPVERGPLYPERAAPEPPTEPSDRSDV